METPADKASHLASNINDGAPLLKQSTLAVSAEKLHRRSLTGFHTWIRLEGLYSGGGEDGGGVGGLELHGIGSYRFFLLCRQIRPSSGENAVGIPFQ